MGIFNRKKQREEAERAAAEAAARVAELEALRAHVDQLEGRMASTEYARSVLDTRLEEFSTRLGAIDTGIGSMGTQLAELTTSTQGARQRIAALEAQGFDLDDVNARLLELSEQVEAAAAADDDTTTSPLPPPAQFSAPTGPTPPDLHDSDLSDAVGTPETDERIDELRRRIDELFDQVGSVDTRVTSVATELANQLTELSSDIDELNNRTDTDRVGADGPTADDTAEIEARIVRRLDAAMEDVSDSTERLAAEQARYEIQFRADLAELAERLRRPGSA